MANPRPAPAAASPSLPRPGPGGAAGADGPILSWNKPCTRVHDAAFGYSLLSWCSTFEFGSHPCLVYKAVSSPRATRCDNWAQGCAGGVASFGPAPISNATHGSPAFLLGQQVSALVHERKRLQSAARDAKRASQPRPAPAAVNLRPGPGGRPFERTRPLLEKGLHACARPGLRLRAVQLAQHLRVRVAPLPRLKSGLLAPHHALRQLRARLNRRRHGLRPGTHQ